MNNYPFILIVSAVYVVHALWGVGMRIRITDSRLIDFGISVGDVFQAFSSNHYGFMIEYKGSLLFVYRDECEVINEKL